MANQYSSEKKTLGLLLSLTSPPIEVPDWQRDYSWDTSAVDTFWQDLCAFSNQYPGPTITDQEYFLGSIVLVNTPTKQLLLDGQQRLATATILLSVIRDFLGKHTQDAATRTSQKYITDFNDATGAYTFKLTLNRYDRDFFRREIQEARGAQYQAPQATLGSHVLIRQARQFFEKRFDELYQQQNDPPTSFQWSLRIRNVLTDHVSVVAVTSTDEDNAAAVFETLNDRGIGLSTTDLLRNLVLRRANSDAAREEIMSCWVSILELENEAGEHFLRHYWLSQHGDVKTRSLYREIKASIQTDNTDSLIFSRRLQDAALIYRDLVAAKDQDPELRRSLEGVALLGAKALLPAILSSYSTGNLEQRRRLLRALIVFFVRHNVVGNLENSRLETIVFNLARDIRQTGNLDAAIETLREAAPLDAQFVQSFRTAQVRRRDSARYLLREIEHRKRVTQEVNVETPDRVHIEHIYPQTPPQANRWPTHIAVIERLGNLTLLAARLNEAIRNADFAAKRPVYEQSDILLTSELAQLNGWDLDAIDQRQQILADIAVQIWCFD